MRVYHGTSPASVPGIIARGLDCRVRVYLPRRRVACCVTRSFAIAQLFALRRSPAQDFIERREVLGVVLEFALSGLPNLDYYALAGDDRCLQDEQEIAVYNPRALRLRGIWSCENDDWVRTAHKSVKPRSSGR